MRVLVAGRDKSTIDTLVRAIDGIDGIETFVRHICNGHSHPLHGLEQIPDVLVFRVSSSWQAELEALENHASTKRPQIVIVAPSSDPEIMRRAMRAGARDFLFEPIDAEELARALMRAAKDIGESVPTTQSRVLAFINAKGGSGATTLASNVAHLMVVIDEFRTVLVDLDFQFGSLPSYLDLQAKHNLLDALEPGGELDAMALEAYMAVHASGLRVLGSRSEGVMTTQDIVDMRLEAFLDLLQAGYERVVIDLPRNIDKLTASVAAHADRIAVVVQQDFANLRDAARLLGIFRNDLAVTEDRLVVVVNRYDKKSAVSLADIERALHVKNPALIPNDYRNVTASINAGTPLHELARSAPVTRAMKALQADLGGRAGTQRQGVLARTFSSILRT